MVDQQAVDTPSVMSGCGFGKAINIRKALGLYLGCACFQHFHKRTYKPYACSRDGLHMLVNAHAQRWLCRLAKP